MAPSALQGFPGGSRCRKKVVPSALAKPTEPGTNRVRTGGSGGSSPRASTKAEASAKPPKGGKHAALPMPRYLGRVGAAHAAAALRGALFLVQAAPGAVLFGPG